MTIIQQLHERATWDEYLLHKQESGHLSAHDEEDLIRFIEREEYLDTLSEIADSGFTAPRKSYISKVQSGKKRVVYIFTRGENYILKCMTFLLTRKYDSHFADNLYSFRARHGVKRAVSFLKNTPGLSSMYVYKSDISDYFNSVDVARLLPALRQIMSDDADTYRLIAALLTDTRVVLPDGSTAREAKGIMAGVPVSSFLANVYLTELDRYFQERNILYARYSDDIILFAPTAEERDAGIAYIREYLRAAHLKMNEAKENFFEPHQKWTFLGVSYDNGVFDISDISAQKLKMKMRRRSRALLRWKAKKNIDNVLAAKAFVKALNRKLYHNNNKAELTWIRWFFPLINTTATLAEIDHYMQDCLRYIATGKRTRGRFRFSYEDMKQLGYRSLVHEYYAIQKASKKNRDASFRP